MGGRRAYHTSCRRPALSRPHPCRRNHSRPAHPYPPSSWVDLTLILPPSLAATPGRDRTVPSPLLRAHNTNVHARARMSPPHLAPQPASCASPHTLGAGARARAGAHVPTPASAPGSRTGDGRCDCRGESVCTSTSTLADISATVPMLASASGTADHDRGASTLHTSPHGEGR